MKRAVLRAVLKRVLVAPLLVILACGQQRKSESDDDAGAGGAGGGPAADACAQYISCVAGTQPGMVGDAIAVYGSEGSCWQELTEAECLNACETGTSQLGASYPQVEACSAGGVMPTRANLYILVDKSGSMFEDMKWENTVSAFTSFFQNANSDDLDVALRFWPDDGCNDLDPDDMNNNDATCSVSACATPQVPLGPLSDSNQQQALINLFLTKNPGGATPMSAALEGGVAWGRATKMNEPNEATAIILVSDGEPNGCLEDPGAIEQIASGSFSVEGIPIFAVGLEGASTTLMNAIASAGGTDMAFFIGSTNGAEELLAALLQIAAGGSL